MLFCEELPLKYISVAKTDGIGLRCFLLFQVVCKKNTIVINQKIRIFGLELSMCIHNFFLLLSV